MNYLKNIDNNVVTLKELVNVKDNQILSLALSKTDNCDLRLFGMAKDEEIRNEVYPMDTMYLCLEGKIKIIEEDKENILDVGKAIAIPMGNKSHIIALENSKMFQIMIKE